MTNSDKVSENHADEVHELQVTAEEEVLKGVYSNLARVTFTKNEFVLGFVFNVGREAHMVSRIIVHPEHMKQIHRVLSESLEEYEGEFGTNS